MKTLTKNGREDKINVRIALLFILTNLLLSAPLSKAADTWNITEDTDIYSGFYPLINIYDTPPNHTTVNIYGGGSDYITTYNQSTLSFFDGHAEAWNNGTVNFSGGRCLWFRLCPWLGIRRSYEFSALQFLQCAKLGLY